MSADNTHTPERSINGNDIAARAPEEHGYGVRPPGYRLPEATRLGRVRLQVADLQRSIAYYQDVLGFAVLNQSGASAMLGTHGEGAVLVELREKKGAAPVPPRGQLGLFHFAVLLPERAALGRLLGHLGKIGARAGASDHLVSEALYLQDPDGLGIEVYADRPRTAWRHEGRQLAMDTRPLDAAGLLRVAGGEAWAGMPPGAVIGHVHLQVADIEQGKAFYHAALGLDQVVWSYPGALFLSAGGYHHHLGINTWGGPGARRPGDGDARLLDWEILLPAAEDVDTAVRSIQAAGYQVDAAEGGWRTADPWGSSLRVASSAEAR